MHGVKVAAGVMGITLLGTTVVIGLVVGGIALFGFLWGGIAAFVAVLVLLFTLIAVLENRHERTLTITITPKIGAYRDVFTQQKQETK